ncbi:hypothetical protein [Pararhizobium gei]|uniref:hypothetical protein n=1 Tax=Pararhizobium gei TaxID=1395951 RepID=UPI0023DB9697|nr:hypothetical protein [Rhizobium gei]
MQAFQLVQMIGHFRAAQAQHQRQKFVGQLEVVSVNAIVAHQQPARETLMHKVLGIPQGGIHRLSFASMRITQKEVPHGGVVQNLNKWLDRNEDALPFHLHEGLVAARSTAIAT